MSCVDVVVPEVPALDILTYDDTEGSLAPGQRVIVRVQNRLHAGFVLGKTRKALADMSKIKPVEGHIDQCCVIDADIWDMALWAGKISMCGESAALRAILPRPVIEGDRIEAPPALHDGRAKFHERNCFNPFDSERVNFYVSELAKPERTLILFPTKEAAANFYDNLPPEIKSQSLLWGAKNQWLLVHTKKVRVVIGSSGAVFAPLKPERIIIEDEANESYMLLRKPYLSARTLAGRRALTLGAELITGGRLPSLKTYLRTRPEPPEVPERKNIIMADIYRSKREEQHGIEGNIPLTFSLVKRTYRELAQGRNVLWILDRLGEASEVFCSNCGQSVRCAKCNGIMRSIHDGNMLRCASCGAVSELPGSCASCGHDLFMGKRPGIEALAKIAGKYYPKVKLYVKGAKKSAMKGLIISTQRGLELCSTVKPALVAWLDLDLELYRPEHNSRFNVYSMLYESYYCGRDRDSDRKVLIQARRDGMNLASRFAEGWGKFIPEELKARENLMLPPYGFVVEVIVEKNNRITREDIIDLLEEAGLFVMDPGEDDLPLYVSTSSLEQVRKVLEPFRKYLKITIRSE